MARITEPLDFEALAVILVVAVDKMTGPAALTPLASGRLFEPTLVNRVIYCGPCLCTLTPFFIGELPAKTYCASPSASGTMDKDVIAAFAPGEVPRRLRSALLDVEAGDGLASSTIAADFAFDLDASHGSKVAFKGETRKLKRNMVRL
ncbi:MAG: hypothetical protein ACRDZ4_15955 [Egibacteraceae bacterium]